MLSQFVLFLKGFAMGIAEVIPGVSGGTLALVTGIYSRFILGIKSVDLALLRAVFTGAFWRELLQKLKSPVPKGEAPTGTPRRRWPSSSCCSPEWGSRS